MMYRLTHAAYVVCSWLCRTCMPSCSCGRRQRRSARRRSKATWASASSSASGPSTSTRAWGWAAAPPPPRRMSTAAGSLVTAASVGAVRGSPRLVVALRVCSAVPCAAWAKGAAMVPRRSDPRARCCRNTRAVVLIGCSTMGMTCGRLVW